MIHISNRKEKFTELKPYCHIAKDNDFIAMTEWSNSEGVDITVSARGQDKHISLTHGELEAIFVLLHYREAK